MQTCKAGHSNDNWIFDDQNKRTGLRWLKKIFILIIYLNGTKYLVLKLSADGMDIFKWFVDASYANHSYMKSHTAGVMKMGKVSIIW